MTCTRHIPRQEERHARSAEEDADDGEDDEGGEEERGNEQHTLFGVGVEEFDRPFVEQDDGDEDDCQWDESVREKGIPSWESRSPVQNKFVKQ